MQQSCETDENSKNFSSTSLENFFIFFNTEKRIGNTQIKSFRERSFLILGTRAEDNFTQLEKISYHN